jgi:hypothetical protein
LAGRPSRNARTLRWLTFYLAFAVPVLLQGYTAWQDGFLTPSQLQANGIPEGVPFVAHGAMWSDATLLAGLMATIMVNYARQWTVRHWAIALSIQHDRSMLRSDGTGIDNLCVYKYRSSPPFLEPC